MENAPTPLRYRMEGDLHWQYTERAEQAAHASHIQRLQPQPEWMALTPELLQAIDAGDHGTQFWLASPGTGSAVLGVYQRKSGRRPQGFTLPGGVRWEAIEVSHVMPFQIPALPNRP